MVKLTGAEKVLEGKTNNMIYRIRYISEKDAVAAAFVLPKNNSYEVDEVYLLTEDEVSQFNIKTTN